MYPEQSEGYYEARKATIAQINVAGQFWKGSQVVVLASLRFGKAGGADQVSLIGGMPEWSNGLVSKTSVPLTRNQRFESSSHRQLVNLLVDRKQAFPFFIYKGLLIFLSFGLVTWVYI